MRTVPPGSGALLAICFGLPLAFLVGGAGFVWILPAITLGVPLFRGDFRRLPRGTAPLLVLLAWVALSVVRVGDPATLFLFGYRSLVLLATAAVYLWLVNVPVDRLSSQRVVGWLAALWVVLIAFGYLAVLFPTVDATSPVQRVLPGSLLANDFLRDLTGIRFAEYQVFLDYTFARPAAPMTYANGWGSTVGLLTPFFVQHWLLRGTARRRRRGAALLLVGFVPIVMSLNRGLWLNLAVGFLYLAALEAVRGRRRLFVACVAVGALAVGGVVLTPLRPLVESRLESTEDSNEDRAAVYEEAIVETLRSPFLGYGQPTQRDDGLPVGTHGLVWYLLYSHGFPAVLLFLWWMASITWRTRAAPTQVAVWAHLVVVMAGMQVFFYGLLPQLVLVGVAAGIAFREQLAARAASVPARHRAPAVA